jgi:hypothetical membrane protein
MGLGLENIDLQPSGTRNGFRLLFAFVLFAAIQGLIVFFGSTTLAILEHPDYSLAGNYLSDLGRRKYEHYYLFNYSLIWLGLSLIPMFFMIWITDPRNSLSAKLTAVFGVLSATGLVGLGASPVDRAFISHHFWLAIWLFPMLYMTVSFFYVASRSPYVGIGFITASLIMVIGMIVYLLNVELTTTELLQKAIVVCGFVWLGYMIAFIIQSGYKVLKNWEVYDDTRARKEASYMSTLKYGNHRSK